MSAPAGVFPALISVCINGQLREVPSGHSIAELLDFLGIAPDRVAVEVNRSIVRKRDWRKTAVTPGSDVEIVEFVGGG